MTPLLSIITNLYQSERFLPSLVRSIVTQPFNDWQLVCVVDASPGRDIEVLDKLVKHYGIRSRTCIIHNSENIGLSRSKALGISNACGRYSCFIDGDDFFVPDCLDKMVKSAVDTDLDFVNFNYYRYFPVINHRTLFRVNPQTVPYARIMERREFMDRCFINFYGSPFIHYGYWAKLYRTEILKNLDFDYPDSAHVFAEDKWFSCAAFQTVNTAMFVDLPVYNWRWGGLSSLRRDPQWCQQALIDDIIHHHDYLMDLIDRYGYYKAVKPYYTYVMNSVEGYFVALSSRQPDFVKQKMEKILAVAPFNHLSSHCFYSSDDAMASAICKGDIDEAYTIAVERSRKGRWLRYGQRFADLIVAPIRHFTY